MSNLVRQLVLVALAVFASLDPLRADTFTQPMQFEYRSAGNSIEATWISATGTITSDTPNRLRGFLEREGAEGGKIVFHSPGGNLLAGLTIGRIIRDYRLATYVGKSEPDAEVIGTDTLRDGICASACAYAFLGGTKRSRHLAWAEGSTQSKLGYHRFYDSRDDLGIVSAQIAKIVRGVSLTEGQILSGLIAAYLSDMGVDAKLLTYANSYGQDEIGNISDEEAQRLSVFTADGFGPWFLEPYGAGLVAASRESDPLTLATQITAYCRSSDGALILMITSDWSAREPSSLPEQSPKGRESPSGATVFVDDDEFQMSADAVSEATSGRLSFYRVTIDDSISDRLNKASNFAIRIDSGRAGGTHVGGGRLHDMDQKMISLAYRNCI